MQRARSLRLKLTLWYLLVFLAVQALLLVLVTIVRWRENLDAYHAGVANSAEVMVDNILNAAPRWTGEELERLLPDGAGIVLCAVRSDSGRILGAFNMRLPELLPFGEAERGETGPIGATITRLSARNAERLSGVAVPLAVVTVPFQQRGERFYLQAAVLDGPWQHLSGPQLDFAKLAFPIGMLAALVAAWLIAGRAVAPIRHLSEAARAVGPESLARPISVQTTDGEYTRLTQELNAALARLHEGYQVLDRFISDVSHELKTPIAVMLTESQVVRMGATDTRRYEEFAREVERQMQQLGRLVESFLALARAGVAPGAGAEPVPLNDLLLESARGASRLAERGRVRLVPRLLLPADDGPDCELEGDATLLRTMLDNLVRNAVRHSPPGAAVEIEATLSDDGARIAVRDRGPGIPEDQLGRVFQPFVRIGTQPGPGSGLGLSIARRIAELHGGSVSAANREGGGCEFTILLEPRAPRGELEPDDLSVGAVSRDAS